MYDGIEDFDCAKNYKSINVLCTAHRFKDIKTLTNESAKSTFELIHLIKKKIYKSVRIIF